MINKDFAIEALSLPVNDRAELAHRLLESLEDSSDNVDEISEANLNHALRVSKAVDEGTMQVHEGMDEFYKIRDDLKR